ncbi:MAG TPA: bifunctional oligoribonuclease/PAP phosphatase NrnA [Candidatus Avirikenella pullistercoris]|nr:bifunctional oligoribonuclease/PAP phosphatase NrnA [Candidatus Avirikenella pullistercoris]
MYNSEKIKNILYSKKNIVLLGHINPDGDAVGALIAFGGYLRGLSYNVTLITPNEAPHFLRKLKDFHTISDFSKNEALLIPKIEKADLIFCLDFNELDTRIGDVAMYALKNVKAQKVLIDHHQNPPLDLYDAAVSDTNASSTCYLVFKILEELGELDRITQEMAEAIYVGMMTDTGNFSYGNLTPDLFRVLSVLVEKGANPVALNSMVFNTQTESRMRLMGYVLYEKMEVTANGNAAYIALSAGELRRFNYKSGDTEGLVNLPLSIADVTLSAIFIEMPDCIKISLRSRGADAVDVNLFARHYFVGGGHKNAAGAKFFGTLEDAVKQFEKGIDELKLEK